MEKTSLVLIALIFLFTTNQLWAFSTIPKKKTLYSREQLSITYGMFEPGNNWNAASNIVNRRKEGVEESTAKGAHLRIRYEDYNWKSFDYRFGIDLQSIDDGDITLQTTMFLIGLADALWRYKTQRILAYGLVGYAPSTIITAVDETLKGSGSKYELGFEYVWTPLNSWSTKFQAAYQYMKLHSFPHTTTFDPSYMTIRGPLLSLGISYIF